MDPFSEGSRGLNHIDARLGVHCNYGVLDPDLDPLFGGTPKYPYIQPLGLVGYIQYYGIWV